MARWMRAVLVGSLLVLLATHSPVYARMEGTTGSRGAAISVARCFPPNMATRVTTTSPLTVEFAGPLSNSFYQSINFTLLRGTQPVDGDLFYNPSARQVMFKARKPLGTNQTYTAQVSFYDGLGQSKENAWTFQTGNPNAAEAKPQAAKVLPPPASPGMAGHSGDLLIARATMANRDVSPKTPLEIQFSEPLEVSTLRSAPVRLLNGKSHVGVHYRLSRDMKTLTLIPRTPLPNGAGYNIAVSEGLSGAGGHRLTKNVLIPFRVTSNGSSEIQVPDHVVEEAPARPMPRTQVSGRKSSHVPAQAQRKNPAHLHARQAAALQVTRLEPAHAAKVTNLTQPVTVMFNREIRGETLNEFTFRLEDDFGPVPAKIQYFAGRRQGTLTPIGILDANRTYRIVITQGVSDEAGTPLARSVASTFLMKSPAQSPATPEMYGAMHGRMAPAQGPATSRMLKSPVQDARDLEVLDDEASMFQARRQPSSAPRMRDSRPRAVQPRSTRQGARGFPQPQRQYRSQKLSAFKVEGILPGSQANNIPRDTKISVHFSEPVDPRSLNSVNISLFGHQERVEGNVVYDANQKRAIFTPKRPLDLNTRYKVRVSDKITSLAGERLAGWFSWEFRTNGNKRQKYVPKGSAEADAAFFIPLVDSRLPSKPVVRLHKDGMGTKVGQAFSFVSPQHWAFKSLRHVVKKGILKSFPFRFTDSVTRYEFANSISTALSRLKSMQGSPDRPKLKIADLVELEKLVLEFRPELRSYGVNPAWFEGFLQRQGVRLKEIQRRVHGLNQKHSS